VRNFFICFLGLILFVTASNTWAYTPEDCIRCHSQESKESALHISIEQFQDSVHGRKITCGDCHTGIKDSGHVTSKGSGAVDCGLCHDRENRHGVPSKDRNRPRCHSCHTRHGILGKNDKASTVHPDQLKKTCSRCHPEECGQVDYLSWLPSQRVKSHKKGDFSQAFEKDNCIGCHQGRAAHGEKEPINGQNCYICHVRAQNRNPVMGYIHAKADLKRQPVVFVAATAYQIFLVLILCGVFRVCIGKLSGKLRRRRK
jgi:hypothetical protein